MAESAAKRICLLCGTISRDTTCRKHPEVEPTRLLAIPRIPANETTR